MLGPSRNHIVGFPRRFMTSGKVVFEGMSAFAARSRCVIVDSSDNQACKYDESACAIVDPKRSIMMIFFIYLMPTVFIQPTISRLNVGRAFGFYRPKSRGYRGGKQGCYWLAGGGSDLAGLAPWCEKVPRFETRAGGMSARRARPTASRA